MLLESCLSCRARGCLTIIGLIVHKTSFLQKKAPSGKFALPEKLHIMLTKWHTWIVFIKKAPSGMPFLCFISCWCLWKARFYLKKLNNLIKITLTMVPFSEPLRIWPLASRIVNYVNRFKCASNDRWVPNFQLLLFLTNRPFIQSWASTSACLILALGHQFLLLGTASASKKIGTKYIFIMQRLQIKTIELC